MNISILSVTKNTSKPSSGYYMKYNTFLSTFLSLYYMV